MMASSTLWTVVAPSEAATASRIALRKSQIRAGQMGVVGSLVLFASEPPEDDLLSQWTVRPVTSFNAIPKFLSCSAKMSVNDRSTNVKLQRRGTKGVVYNIFARCEGGKLRN